ncbi:MAG TPA: hypothetical protein VNO24_27895, partial [Blastocatellia bacterium]|nr:hypothetical protein [Blastocatellia bacterium]
ARVAAFSRYSGKSGWYFVTGWGSGVPHYNSHSDGELTEQEAKDAAMARVRRALAASDNDGGGK